MSAIEKLAQSAKNRHGRQLQPGEVQEIVEALSALQYYAKEYEIKNEALTKVSAVALQRLGGGMLLTPEEYDAATKVGVEVTWDDEEGTIYAKIYEVEMSEVQPQADPDGGEDDGDMAPVPGERGTQEELALEETDTG